MRNIELKRLGIRMLKAQLKKGRLLLLIAASYLVFSLASCSGAGRLRLGTESAQRPVNAGRSAAKVRVLDLTASDQLAIGERYLELGYNFRAKREFMRVIEEFPGAPETAVAQYKIGLCYLKEEMYKEALEQFRLFVSNFPNHELADAARRRVRLLEFKIEKPELASCTGPADLEKSRKIRQHLERIKVELASARGRADRLGNTVKRLEDEKRKLEQRFQGEITRLQYKLVEAEKLVQDKNDELKRISSEHDYNSAEKQKAMVKVNTALQNARNEIKVLETKLRAQNKVLSDSQAKSAGLAKQIQFQAEALEKAQGKITKLEKAISQKKKNEIEKNENKFKKFSGKQGMASQPRQINNSNKQVEKLHKEISELRARAQNAETRIAELSRKLAFQVSLQAESARKKKIIEKSKSELTARLEELEKKFQKQTRRISILKDDLKTAREQLAAEKEKRREIESKARILMSRIDKET
ncbi:MAG: tetratricopeptide repeat protein, partial [Deltaproteobacteria bacterium]|nr:tetratricopeptide repeat protein [Deltaproteobacteria bacterium]